MGSLEQTTSCTLSQLSMHITVPLVHACSSNHHVTAVTTPQLLCRLYPSGLDLPHAAALLQASSPAPSGQAPHPASAGPPPRAPSGDQDMADADDDEPAPPADVNIAPSTSGPTANADTAMDEGPSAPGDSSDGAAAMDTEAAPGSRLGQQLLQAAQDAGIDLAFLEALPEELRAEVQQHIGFQHAKQPCACSLLITVYSMHASSACKSDVIESVSRGVERRSSSNLPHAAGKESVVQHIGMVASSCT